MKTKIYVFNNNVETGGTLEDVTELPFCDVPKEFSTQKAKYIYDIFKSLGVEHGGPSFKEYNLDNPNIITDQVRVWGKDGSQERRILYSTNNPLQIFVEHSSQYDSTNFLVYIDEEEKNALIKSLERFKPVLKNWRLKPSLNFRLGKGFNLFNK